MDIQLKRRGSNLHCYVNDATEQGDDTIKYEFTFCRWKPDPEGGDGEYEYLEDIIIPIEDVSDFWFWLRADGWRKTRLSPF